MAHNGNITNAGELRRELEREGSIFQASSDTEVILHLVARSRETDFSGGFLREALLQLEGAFSLVFLAGDRVLIARDPHGDAVRWRLGRWNYRADAPATCLRRRPARST